MSLQFVIACALAFAVLVASVRMLLRLRGSAIEARPRAWRVAVLLFAQAASAALLYCVLFPPMVRTEAGTLVVATADADRALPAGLPPGAHLVAMPEAPVLRDAERMPDLATALRRYPATARIRVIGGGLVERDQQIAQGLALDFVPAPLPRGLIALWPPRQVQAGSEFHVAGRAANLVGGSVELLDPGNAIVARAAIGADGRFLLAGNARDAGLASWRLRLRNRDRTYDDDIALPLVVAPDAPLRVRVLAGAPNPELKYLRRWATDAGLSLDARISLGAGMQIGDAPAAFDAASLGKLDLVVLDQRAWQSLGAAQRTTLDRAIRDGLGLLLRMPAALTGNDRAALRRLGFTATQGGAVSQVQLQATPGSLGASSARPGDTLPTLTRAAARVSATDGSGLLPDSSGTPLATWRAHGLGRVGVATFDDSFRLVLAGHADRHGALWSRVFSTLARAQATPGPTIGDDPRIDQRLVLCGVHGTATIDAPDGQAIKLAIDPASGARACAGFWPRRAGWHVLRDGERRTAFHVRDAGQALGLQAAAQREATRRLVLGSPATVKAAASRPGARWPWFVAWLLLTAALWWFERSRAGAARDFAAGSGA